MVRVLLALVVAALLAPASVQANAFSAVPAAPSLDETVLPPGFTVQGCRPRLPVRRARR